MSDKSTPELPSAEAIAAAAPAPAPAATASSAVKITLNEPLKRESGDISALTLRKPKAGEMRGLKVGDLFNGEVGAVLTLIPRICDPFITEHEAAELDAADLAEIAGTVTGFFMTPAQKAMVEKMLAGSA